MNHLAYIEHLAAPWHFAVKFRDSQRLVMQAPNTLVLKASVTESTELRLELVLVGRVSSARLALWNFLHLNHFYFPLGQIVVSPKRELVLRLNLPTSLQSCDWIETALVYALTVAEGWIDLLRADHQDLPLTGPVPQPNVRDVVSAGPPWISALSVLDADAGLHILERILVDAFGSNPVRRLNARELAITDEFVCHIHLLHPRRHIFPDPAVSWYLGLRTEVGCLPRLDANLVLRLNRYNCESVLMACALVYYQSRHLVLLTSGLPLEMLQYPSELTSLIVKHQQQAAALYNELQQPYGLRSIAGFHLGF